MVLSVYFLVHGHLVYECTHLYLWQCCVHVSAGVTFIADVPAYVCVHV